MKGALFVLCFDSLAGLVAGVCTIVLASSVTVWHGWPEGFARFVGAANITYGCYSGALALRLRWTARLSRWTIIALVVANSAWAGQCFAQAWWLRDSASYLGLSHLIFEGLFVGGLACLEARFVLPVAARNQPA